MNKICRFIAGENTGQWRRKTNSGEIANTSTPSPAVYMARALVAVIDKTEFQWPIPVLPTIAAQRRSTQRSIVGEPNTNIFSLYPNPTTGTFTVNAPTAGELNICTFLGSKIAVYSLQQGKNDITIPTKLAVGVYLVRFQAKDGKTSFERKLIFNP